MLDPYENMLTAVFPDADMDLGNREENRFQKEILVPRATKHKTSICFQLVYKSLRTFWNMSLSLRKLMISVVTLDASCIMLLGMHLFRTG